MRHDRIPQSRCLVRSVRRAALGPLRAFRPRSPRLRAVGTPAYRIFPRSCSHRAHAVRRRRDAGPRTASSGSFTAGNRPRVQACGCRTICRMSASFPIHIDRRQQSASDGASDAKRRELAMRIDAAGLEADLKASIEGEVRFDPGSRALYATAGSNYRQVPIGVVVPRTLDDVVNAVAVARRHGAPILARGGGTSLAGQCCNVAVVLDCSKYLHGIIDLDPARRRATVQPGVVLDDLRAAAERYRLTYGPDPSTHSHCTLGGMIGNNSCGVHSVMAGQTSDNVEQLEVLTYDGLRLTLGKTTEAGLDRIIQDGGRRG